MSRPDDNLNRLAHLRPDLADRVRAGAMSVHDALILAGNGPWNRKKKIIQKEKI